MSANRKTDEPRDANRDPITGEAGSHPVGVGVGTAAGTAAGAAAGAGAAVAIGAAAGSVAGPVGTAVGAAIGGIAAGVAGAFAGKAIAEGIDPTAEEAYWEGKYQSRPYAKKGAAFATYQPAYRYGVMGPFQHEGRSFAEAEADLSGGWTDARGSSNLSWDEAQPAVRDAYERVYGLRQQRSRGNPAARKG